MGSVGRVKELLENSVGKSNKDRTRYFVEQARLYFEHHPDIKFSEIKVPFSNQLGYALVIPPEEITDDSEYILLSAHLDAVQGPLHFLGKHKPGANDNGFAAAFLQSYMEELGDKRSEKGLIIAGFPHEEGSELFRTIALLGMSVAAPIGFSKGLDALNSHINQTTSFLLAFFGAFQLYDVVGSPLKIGLIGSSEPFRNVLQDLEMDLEKIVCAVNLDMIGTAGKTTEVSIPYKSPTMNPTWWLFPKEMDRSLVSDMESMLLCSAAQDYGGEIDKFLINHQLLLGSSDHAELSKYIKKTSGIIHINNWRDIHEMRDSIDKLSFSNVELYDYFLKLMSSSIDKSWKDESQIRLFEERGFISNEISRAEFYELEDETFCLLRREGDKDKNPLNVLYSVEDTLGGYAIKEFVTYGLQDNPRELLRYPDSNLNHWLSGRETSFEKIDLEDKIILSMGDKDYSTHNYRKRTSDYGVEFGSKVYSFLAERSLGGLFLGLAGLTYFLYNKYGGGGPADYIIEATSKIRDQLHYSQGLMDFAWRFTKITTALFGLGLISAGLAKGLMKITPPLKRAIRNLNVAAGNRSLDYHVNT